MHVPLRRLRRLLGFVCVILAVVSALHVAAQNTPIALSTRRDMVFDHSGAYLYVSTSDGFVRRYNIAAAQFDATYNLGGSLNGIDISPNDAFLFVAQSTTGVSQGTFHRLDLSNGSVTNINYTGASGETGGWDVKIGANNIALVTTQFSGSGWTPLRQIDLSTNTISARSDAPGSGGGGQVRQNTAIERSADASRMYLQESNISSGPVFTYSGTTNTFGPSAQTDAFVGSAAVAVNRTGSIVATQLGNIAFDSVPAFNYVRTLRKIDGGIAFDAVQDRFYGVSSSTGRIIACDTNTYKELYRISIGENVTSGATKFGAGALVASGDGRFLAFATATGIRVFTLPTGPYPPPAAPTFGTPRDMVFDHAGPGSAFTLLQWKDSCGLII